MALHCTAIGKVILAWQTPENLKKLLDSIELTPSTQNTITGRVQLEEHLEMVRRKGWGLDDQENEPHVRCLGAPIHSIEGGVTAAISISGLATQFDGEYLTDLSEELKAACEKLSRKLGVG